MTEIFRFLMSSTPEPGADKTGEARRCVVVIDDDNTIRATLSVALGKEYSIIGLGGGGEVAAFIESRNPRLLILDIDLPGSDGLEMCGKIRSQAETRRLPILFMTGRKDDRGFLNSLAAGGNAFITKPFELSELRRKIEHLLKEGSGDVKSGKP